MTARKKSQSPSSGALIRTQMSHTLTIHIRKDVAIAFQRRTHSDPTRWVVAPTTRSVGIAFQRRTHSDMEKTEGGS